MVILVFGHSTISVAGLLLYSISEIVSIKYLAQYLTCSRQVNKYQLLVVVVLLLFTTTNVSNRYYSHHFTMNLLEIMEFGKARLDLGSNSVWLIKGNNICKVLRRVPGT